jgi:chemotaxis protein MotB
MTRTSWTGKRKRKSKMKRRKRESRKVDPNGWLTTYSDMITLCLTFFVLLYSFSSLDSWKWRSVVISLKGALGVMDGGESVFEGPLNPEINPQQGSIGDKGKYDPEIEDLEDYLKYQEETKRLEQVKAILSEYLRGEGLEANITLSLEERGLVIRFEDSVLFAKGKADILPQAVTVLNKLSAVFGGMDNYIRIEGHTDNLPIHTRQFPSNWELSTTRATNVLRFLLDEGVSGERLSAVGYGEFHPIAPNDNEEDRRKNRRVDIVIIRESQQKIEPR